MATRKDKAKITRKRILDIAFKTFSAKGYLNTTMDEIAERANVGKGTVFRHFSSKLNLALEITQMLSEVYLEQIEQLLAQGDEFDAAIDIIFSGSETSAMNGLNITQLLFSVLLDIKDTNERKEIISVARESLQPIYERLGKVFESLNLREPLLLSRLFIGILDGITLQLILEGREKDEKLLRSLSAIVKKMMLCH